jgi:hypothetical protein
MNTQPNRCIGYMKFNYNTHPVIAYWQEIQRCVHERPEEALLKKNPTFYQRHGSFRCATECDAPKQAMKYTDKPLDHMAAVAPAERMQSGAAPSGHAVKVSKVS